MIIDAEESGLCNDFSFHIAGTLLENLANAAKSQDTITFEFTNDISSQTQEWDEIFRCHYEITQQPTIFDT